MFSSVLFRRIFFSISILCGGSFLIFYLLSTALLKRTAYEARLNSVRIGLEAVENLVDAFGADLERLREMLSHQTDRLADYYVLDSNLRPIAASNSVEPSRDFKKILGPLLRNLEKGEPAAEAVAPVESIPKGFNMIRVLGEAGEILFGVKYLPRLDRVLIAAVDERTLEGADRGVTNRVAVLGGLVFCGAIFFIGIFVNHFLKPIRLLASLATEFIQKGEIAENRYLVDKGDIGVLGAAFFKMAGSMETAQQILKTWEREQNTLIGTSERARGRAYDMTRATKRMEQEIESFKNREISLKKSEERYRAMLENIEEYFYEVDLLGNLIFFNDALNKMLGFSKEELVGKNFREFMDEDTAEKAFRTFNHAYETGQPAKGFEWRLTRKDGTRCFVEISVSLIRDVEEEIIGFRGVARDVSELIYLVYHDSLTGLYNRKAFFEKLKDTLAFARRDKNEKNIFYMDLDKFKKVNDVYGHDVGDGVLKEVAARLKTTLRETDHICRLGGDEFTIILNNLSGSRPEEAAQRIIDALSRPYEIKDHIIDFITPSIGISAFPKDADDSESLIWCADIAMFEAKRKRGTFAFYTEEMGTRYSEMKKIVRDTPNESA